MVDPQVRTCSVNLLDALERMENFDLTLHIAY